MYEEVLYQDLNGGSGGSPLVLKELPLYGSSRLGIAHYYSSGGGQYLYHYELSDHLGNVRAVIRRDILNGNLEVVKYGDYYPFGWGMPGRQGEAQEYRFGYQGQYAEKDEETGWNSFELRSIDSRVGRWMTIDPMEEFWSPYVSMGNRPHILTDPTGGQTDYEYRVNADGTTERIGNAGGEFLHFYQFAEGHELAGYTAVGYNVFNELTGGGYDVLADIFPAFNPSSNFIVNSDPQSIISFYENPAAYTAGKEMFVHPVTLNLEIAGGIAIQPTDSPLEWALGGWLRGGGKSLANKFVNSANPNLVVLGHSPGYVSKAKQLGARYFDIPKKYYSWGANKKFLQRAINRGDSFYLNTPFSKIRPGSVLQKEVKFLLGNGFQVGQGGRYLIKTP